MIEWEREREKDEFSRAAMLYQPLKGDIALRFTRGKNIDDDFSDKVWFPSLYLKSSPKLKSFHPIAHLIVFKDLKKLHNLKKS